MKQHSEKLKVETERQKEVYHQELARLQAEHEQRITQIQKKEPKNKIKMEEIIAQCQLEEKDELETFRYEL